MTPITKWKALHCDAIDDGIHAVVSQALAALTIVVYCLEGDTMMILPEEEFRFDENTPQHVKEWVVTHIRTFTDRSFACIPSCSIAIDDTNAKNHVSQVGDLILSESRDAIIYRPVMTPAIAMTNESIFPRGSYPSFLEYGFLSYKVRLRMANGECVI
jgi:hypothetical protein